MNATGTRPTAQDSSGQAVIVRRRPLTRPGEPREEFPWPPVTHVLARGETRP